MHRFVLFADNFSDEVIPGSPLSPYIFTFDPAGHDGTATATENNMTVSSVPFTTTTDGLFDHVKYLVYQSRSYVAPSCNYEIVYESVINATQTLPTEIPYPDDLRGVNNAAADPRVASSALNVVDPDNFLVFDIMFTNQQIFAVYERLPIGRTATNNYCAFTHLIPIGQCDPTTFTKVAIAYNKKAGYVRWLINGQEKFRVDRLGFPIDRKYRILDHGGIPSLIVPRNLLYGFGTFTLLDMYNPNNPGAEYNSGLLRLAGFPEFDPLLTTQVGEPVPATFVQNVYDANFALFGQGATMKLVYLTVYIQNSDCCQEGLPSPKCCNLLITQEYLNSLPGVLTSNAIYQCRYRRAESRIGKVDYNKIVYTKQDMRRFQRK